MSQRIHAPLVLLTALACATPLAHAGRTAVTPPDLSAAITAADRTTALGARASARERSRYARQFERAYALYPHIPRGTLEAVAYAQTGWSNVQPRVAHRARDGHLPPAYGVMGLYNGGGFRDQVAEAARALGVSQAQVRTNPEVNIIAGALLLDRAMRRDDGGRLVLADSDAGAIARALMRYAAFPAAAGKLVDYARQSFAYDVLLAMRDGVSHEGVAVPARPVVLEQAFDPAQLRLLRAPVLKMDVAADSIARVDDPMLAPTRPSATAADFGEAIWNPASPSNYSTAGNGMSAVIMHTMEGSYAGAISWFQNPSAQVSAHYLLRKSDGQITQMVREYHQAWHAAYHNGYTIGLEHEGYASDPGTWTDPMVNASARLTKSICARRGVNCASAWQGPGYDTWHVVPDSVRVKGHGMLTNNQNRYDPGKYFPWARYYGLINGGAPPPAQPLYWVDTYANAPGYASPTSTTQTGTLNAGTSYVYCRTWGREVRNGSSFNHWWLKTDLDVGPSNQWVSAYYLSRWGNDEAKDNNGDDIPGCDVLPYGKIGEKWYALGGVRSVVGGPKLKEMDAKLGGRFQQFAKGIILWHEDTGAFPVYGQILDQFWATGGELEWGFAMMDELNAAKSPATGQQGRFQYFQKALFLWTPATGPHVLHGAILDHFEDTGREAKYGYPTADEQAHGTDGRKQAFEKATFYWTPARGVWTE